MSLQFIIDGYNVINHPAFKRQNLGKTKDQRSSLLEFISSKKPCGSPKNKVIVVFDGFPGRHSQEPACGIRVVFSGEGSADDKIRMMLEASVNPKNTVVVSDDKEVRLAAKLFGARPVAVEEFSASKADRQRKGEEAFKELSYSQMHKINQELKKLWLE
jgi:predicted RNA-binding protein with PIN domain